MCRTRGRASARPVSSSLAGWAVLADSPATRTVEVLGQIATADRVAHERFRQAHRWPHASGVRPPFAGHLPGDATVRDAVGWLLVAAQVGVVDPVALVGPWADAGLGADGWLYAAAGLTPVEAAAALADGALSSPQALVLAAVRQVVPPVG